jgi:hypothetical protein
LQNSKFSNKKFENSLVNSELFKLLFRILMAMAYKEPLKYLELEQGEEVTLVGNPSLNYGKHRTYTYENYGVYSAYVHWCRAIAIAKGYSTFSDLFDKAAAGDEFLLK